MKIPVILTMVLWITPLLLQVLIGLAMLIRHQVRMFPAFFTYTVSVVLRDVILLLARGNSDLYSLIYWTGEAVLVMLGMAIIYEVFWQLIKPHHFLRLIGRQLLWLAIALLFGVGVVLFFSSYDKAGTRSIQIVLLAERSARFVQVGALVAIVTLVSYFGLGWRHYTAGIVTGFGVYAGLQLGLYELKTNLHGINDEMFTLLTPVAYNLAAIIWGLYLLPPHRNTNSEPSFVVDLSKLDRMLGEFIKK
jgi:hypothetical protein